MEQALYRQRFKDTVKRRQLWRILVQDYFQQFFEKDDSVLDLACGYGEFINQVRAKRKYGVDLNPDAAKKLNREVTFFHTKASAIPLAKAAIDAVFVSNFFEHIDKKETVKTIKEIQRILKPGGRAVILQPNIRFCQNDYWMFFDHITPVDDRALKEIFESNGFRLRKCVERFLPYTTQSRLPQTEMFIKLYLKLPFIWKLFGRQSLLLFERI